MPPFYEKQLEFIRWLHELRMPWLDEFFKFLNYFDRPEFLFILIPAIWVGYHWKSGLRIFYILMLSGITNTLLKALFMEPRPFQIDPSLGLLPIQGYGFPSGAAQTVILLSGILLNSYRNKWAWIVCANYVFWISLSRIYLGAHFPTDILGGWVVGALLWALYTYVRPLLEKRLEKLDLLKLFVLSQVVPLLVLDIAPRFALLALAVGAGLSLSKYFNLLLNYPKNRKQLVLRAVVGVVGTFALASLGAFLPIDQALWNHFFQSIAIGLWLSLGANLVL